MDRRIYGLETEFGLTCTQEGKRRLAPDEVARYMFRSIVAWGRSSNVFLGNGARLYLDVGNHPEYASAECDTLPDLLAQDRAGEQIVQSLVQEATARLAEDGVDGRIYLFKNNLDSAGTSYGCHENYLVPRTQDLNRLSRALLPFLITRQVIVGAGHILTEPDGSSRYCLSQRADVMWEGASSATTRSRPMINTRDEPHADADRFRRLHVIVGDSNMSETTTLLKVGATDLVLRLLEAGVEIPDLTLGSESKAIRAINRDLTGSIPVPLATGITMTPVQIQREYQQRAADYLAQHGPARPLDEQVLDLWDRTLSAVETGRWELVDTEIDWIIKHRLLTRYAQLHDLELGDMRIRQLELSYHDVDPSRGLFARLRERGGVTCVVDQAAIDAARTYPPSTTRAHLRGMFVREADRRGRDYTVDWSHLRLNDQAQRTVLCKDPFLAQDDRVEHLMELLADPAADLPPR
ncbi:Pup--protein ligase [Gephyromycinifex aptenodytis]|uniref:Pup--protein ligase n=1 Tax=Gephyromycinifex aptenodytis TaxID=2716227 RepID=UPI001446379B|nr:Pup--protein ligase [Gephyromycinifex aptenodytis]